MSVLKKDQWGLTSPGIEKIFSYNWTISNYSYVEKQANKVQSPLFAVDSGEKLWILNLIPKNKYDYLELFLHWNWEPSSFQKEEITFKGWCYISVLDAEGRKFTEEAIMIDSTFKVGHWPTFLKRSSLWSGYYRLLPNNSLKIRCEFVIHGDEFKFSSSDDQLERSLEEVEVEPKGIEKLFLDDRLSDVKLIVSCGESLPAHRSILAAFSPVFEAMFVNDMREKAEGEVKIDDSNVEVLKEMLRFVYTGKVENFASNAAELISLADKYQISELRCLCEKKLSKTMSVENVLEILAIAHHHDIEHLIKEAINFIKAYHRVIVSSDAFKALTDVQVLKTVTEAISQMNNSI